MDSFMNTLDKDKTKKDGDGKTNIEDMKSVFEETS